MASDVGGLCVARLDGAAAGAAEAASESVLGNWRTIRVFGCPGDAGPGPPLAPPGAPRQRAVWASFAKSPGSLRQVPRRLRRVSEVASWPRLGRLGRVWRRLAGVWAGVPRLGCVSRASLASRGSGFGPGVVFRGRGFGPGVVSGVFFFASRPRPASPARLGRVWGVLAASCRVPELASPASRPRLQDATLPRGPSVEHSHTRRCPPASPGAAASPGLASLTRPRPAGRPAPAWARGARRRARRRPRTRRAAARRRSRA